MNISEEVPDSIEVKKQVATIPIVFTSVLQEQQVMQKPEGSIRNPSIN